jgi:hypothetical protein
MDSPTGRTTRPQPRLQSIPVPLDENDRRYLDELRGLKARRFVDLCVPCNYAEIERRIVRNLTGGTDV